MKLKLKKQKGETLAEAVVAMAVFAVLLLGITNFISAQIHFVARLHHRDNIINKAQILVASDDILAKLDSLSDTDDYKWDSTNKVLTVKDGVEELDFVLP